MKKKRAPRPKRPRAAKGSGAAAGASQETPKEPLWLAIGRWALWITGAFTALAAIGLLGLFPSQAGPGTGRDVELVLPGDESPDVLAARLEAAGLTTHPGLMSAYIRFSGGSARVAKGTHLVTDDLSARELLARLERGTSAGHVKVTIPEGFTRFDIAKRLQGLHICSLRTFLDASTSAPLLHELGLAGDSAEGFLFPATYELAPDSDPGDVVRRMKGEFDKRWGGLSSRGQDGLSDLAHTLQWDVREVITLASMVEKEAVVDDERPLIASVFLNRLRDPSFTPKILQCDPTAGYGCLVAPERAPSCIGYTGKITHDIVADAQNPYNTYKHEGLPPGPISNPGAKSIDAVLHPATTRYFYFVARGEGRSTFSETYGAHSSAVHGGH